MAPPRRSHFYSALYIIEYLSPLDVQTGSKLFDNLRGVAQATGTHVALSPVENRSDFLKALQTIESDCRKHGRGPILHLETHGSVNGITSKGSPADLVPWRELKPYLVRLNVLSRMNLLVTMAACYGFELVRTLLPTERSPLWGMVGPETQAMPSDILNGFTAFYGTLFAQRNLNSALDALRNADSSYPENWKFQNAEFFFAWVYGLYLATHAAPENRVQRIESIIARRRSQEHLTTAQERQLRRGIANKLDNEEATFQEMKTKFLMLDLFSENAPRFPITMTRAAAMYEELAGLLKTKGSVAED